ncbi:DUF695 domain-containing protein [Paenibacillus sp. GCM10023250]|uniref:DUF695 domain-containing protein n=1 Tax=Paenibacillus sp. GCM10023250 TaxID=3252648 RepID=UPI00360EF83F
MPDNWGFYERRAGGEQLRVLVNTVYKGDEPAAEYPELLSITVNLYPVRDQSKNRRQFIAQLEELESKLESWLENGSGAIYAGRINAATRLEFYYYLPADRPEEEAVRAWLLEHWPHRAQCYVKPDPAWEFYRYLLPDTLEELFVHNAQMIYALIHKGDQIAQPRNVYHWLLFREDEDRLAMERVLEKQGYVIEKEKESKPEQDYPYPLVISKFEDVKLDTVNARVRELHRLLADRDGRYDGWGAVMRLSPAKRFRRYVRRRKESAHLALRRVLSWRCSQSNQNETSKH